MAVRMAVSRSYDGGTMETSTLTITEFLLPYADHPGYREEWRP